MKIEILKFKRVTSTNDIAINMIKNKKRKDGCVQADIQTKGKGTYGKEWVSKKGNLFSSIFFQLNKSYPTYDEFSVINAILISNVIKNFCVNTNVKLKFPNDIFVNGKKICGILQEIICKNGKNYFIVGIGLNVNNKPKINRYPTVCLKEIINKKIKIKDISNNLFNLYNIFLKKGIA